MTAISKSTDQQQEQPQPVPVLCYHNIRASIDGHKPDYTIATDQFRAHLQMLADSGYHTILPGQLYAHLTTGMPLPARPVMISFDDTREEHFTIAAPLLARYHFKAVFFIMTVSIGRPGYMTAGQIKQLADDGHTIGGHTWNHSDMRHVTSTDWEMQLNRPHIKLEQITGKPVEFFAYPFGAWNETAIRELKKRGIKAAFQLSGKQSRQEPLFTIRRLPVPGNWTAATLYKYMHAVFKPAKKQHQTLSLPAISSSPFFSIFSFTLFTVEEIGPFILSCGSVLPNVSGSGSEAGLSCFFFCGLFF